MWNQELENLVSAALKALDGSNFEVRKAIGSMMGVLLSVGHNPKLSGIFMHVTI